MTRLPVLTYHAIDDVQSPLAVSPAVFARTMQGLARAGWRTLTEPEVASGLVAGAWPDRSVVLHFDDGLASVKTHALPVLRDCGFTATVFVVTGWVGRSNDWPGQPAWVPRWPTMTWDDLAALRAEGLSLGAHTAQHPRLREVPAQQRRDEILRSCARLTQECGAPPDAFAFPYGAVDDVSLDVVRGAVTLAYGTELGYVTAGDDRHHLPRIDACYLGTGDRIGELDSLTTRAWLGARSVARTVRARFGR